MVPGRFWNNRPFWTADRAVSPVVGVTLMVAITVVLAAVVVALLTGTVTLGVAPTTDTAVSLDSTNAGTDLSPQFGGSQEVDVRLNGETLVTINGSDTGRTIFLPTAPGDEVLLVASDGKGDVLIRETFDADEAGDFVAYYPFDDGGGTTLKDESLNGNDGTLEDDPQWVSDAQGSALEFDGSDDYVQVDNLNTGTGDVEEFTVAVTFQPDSTGSIQQLAEHNAGGEEWHVETTGDSNVRFAVNYTAGEFVETTSDPLTAGKTYVVTGTYDGQQYDLYLNGSHVGGGSYDSEVNMGNMRLGKDDSGAGQEFDGRVYEYRLYYTAFDDHQAEMLEKVMD